MDRHPASRYRVNAPHFELRPNAQPDPATLERSLNYAAMGPDDQPPQLEAENPRETDNQQVAIIFTNST